MTERIKQIVDHRAFGRAVLLIILLAAILVGLETSQSVMARYGGLMRVLDVLVVSLFVLEAILKMMAHGRQFYRYFRDPWNVFDFVIVLVCLLPFIGSYPLVLRLARVLRALRLVSVVPKLQVLVHSLMRSLPSMGYVGLLLLVLFYIYAVLGVYLWRDNDPVHFHDLGTAMLSLFRVVTLEDWTDIMYIQIYGSAGYTFTPNEQAVIDGYADYESKGRPLLSVAYFVSFVLLGTIVMLNLVIDVIITAMSEVRAEAKAEAEAEARAEAKALEGTTEYDRLTELEHQLDQAMHGVRGMKYECTNRKTEKESQ